MNRIREGFVDVRNPFYPKLISRIYFEDVDLILFCTKNPLPLVNQIEKINIPILLHVTITPYKKNIEENVPDKKKVIEAVKKLSSMIGKDRVYIRYDPIFLNEEYTIKYHIKAFQRLCDLLEGFTSHIIISFIDDYKNVRENSNILKIKEFSNKDYQEIATNFSKIANNHSMSVQTCFEKCNLVEYGFIKGDCLDPNLAFKLTGKTNFKKWKARKKNQCNCVEMVDIGAYNSCKHYCRYCYANYNSKIVENNYQNHIPSSSLLVGKLQSDDIIKIRK